MENELAFVKELLNNTLYQNLTYQYENLLTLRVSFGSVILEYNDGFKYHSFNFNNIKQLCFKLEELFNLIDIKEYLQKNIEEYKDIPFILTSDFISIDPFYSNIEIDKYLFNKGYKPTKSDYRRIVI